MVATGRDRLLCGAWAPHGSGLSSCGSQAVGHAGSVVVAHRP